MENTSTPIPKPNFTAWFVMQGLIAAMRHPAYAQHASARALALYEPLSEAASKTRLISRIIHSLPYRLQYMIGGLVTDSQRLRHFCFRKKEIEKHTRALLGDATATQIIILGAGLDMLSMQLAQDYPHVQFIEIDTGESQAFKTSTVQNLPRNVTFINGDLRDPLADILASCAAYNANAKTLWIAEGFFMFIPEASVASIFAAMRTQSAPGSHVIFTTLSSQKPASRLRYMLQSCYLRKEKSPYQWAVPFQDVEPFLQKMGYECLWQIDYNGLQKTYIPTYRQQAHLMAENIHIAKN